MRIADTSDTGVRFYRAKIKGMSQVMYVEWGKRINSHNNLRRGRFITRPCPAAIIQ